MKNEIIVFGAGSIGRSFLTPLFLEAGYRVYLTDINENLLRTLRERGEYDLTIRSDEGEEKRVVSGYEVILPGHERGLTEALLRVPLMATAVGQKGLPGVCSKLREILPHRKSTLDFILAENIRRGSDFCRDLLKDTPGLDKLGLVETSIGKMVPLLSEEDRRRDPLALFGEPYNTLILDRDGFLGEFPTSPHIKLVSPIKAYVDRKLFIHNLGHAATAYLGRAAHPERTFIWEVLEDREIGEQVREAMAQAARALEAQYPAVFTRADLERHIDDLLHRFGNKALGDTVYRVGRDLTRKLSPEDRLRGAVALAERHGLAHDAIDRVIEAAGEFGKYEPSDRADREYCQPVEKA